MSNVATESLDFILRGTESVHVSQESKDAFKNCMNSEAIYKAGIPWGTLTAICVYGMCNYHKVSPMMKLVSIPFGIMGFNIGRLAYSRNCATKYVPELPDLLRAKLIDIQRRSAQDTKLFESNALWTEDQTSSNEFNTAFGDNSNQLPDASSDTDTPETSKLNESKQRVTYEELRRQNRTPYYGNFRSRQPVQEKVPTRDPELLDEDSINKTKQRIWD